MMVTPTFVDGKIVYAKGVGTEDGERNNFIYLFSEGKSPAPLQDVIAYRLKEALEALISRTTTPHLLQEETNTNTILDKWLFSLSGDRKRGIFALELSPVTTDKLTGDQ
jgi:hypothetical protein